MCRVYGVSTWLGIIVSLFVVVVLAMTKQQGEVFARRFSESFFDVDIEIAGGNADSLVILAKERVRELNLENY